MIYGCIYVIKNKINGKMYIGKSLDVINRVKSHFSMLNENRHHNIHLQRSYNKYGKENFKVIIIEENIKKEKLSEREIFWIDYFNTFKGESYNLTEGGDGFTGTHNKEVKNKISISMKMVMDDVIKRKISDKLSGRKLDEKTKNKISNSMKGKNNPFYNKHHTKEIKNKLSEINKGKVLSKETRKKMSKSQKGKKHSYDTKKKIGKSNRKLTKKQCLEIYGIYKNSSKTQTYISNMFNIDISVVSRIVNLNHWSSDYIEKNKEVIL